MDMLPLNFRTLRLCGIWHEENENPSRYRTTYRLIVIFFIFYFTVSITVEAGIMRGETRERMETTGLAFTYLALCLKILNFVLRREKILGILRDLREHCCRPKNSAELAILKRCDHTARRLFVILLGFVLSAVAYFLLEYLMTGVKFETYQFYDVSNPRVLGATLGLYLVTIFYSVFMNVSFDTMSASLLILVIGQLEINAHRLARIGRGDRLSMRNWIAHNAFIHRIIEKIGESFVLSVIPFFLFSLMSIGITIFQMSKCHVVSLEFLKHFMLVASILLQVLINCWYGNEMMLKSKAIANAVYQTNWTILNARERRALQVIMICNQQDQAISYRGLCILNLDTFLWILNTTYAMVNLLRRVNAE